MKRKAPELEELSSEEAEEDSADQTSSSDSGSASASFEDGSSDSGSNDKQEVDVDFEFFDPREIDFHGLKALLQTYLDGTAFNCSELVDTVIKQVFVTEMLSFATAQLCTDALR